jgi:hypothetical protein
MLVVFIDHPGIENERVTEEHAMPTRIFEFERAVVGDDRERDEIAKTGNGVDRGEGLRRVGSNQENGRRQLNPKASANLARNALKFGWVRPRAATRRSDAGARTASSPSIGSSISMFGKTKTGFHSITIPPYDAVSSPSPHRLASRD